MPQKTILFVCEHGAAKSIIAATYFNRLAGKRGFNWNAIARGTNPDTALSEQTVLGLSQDGLVPTESVPQKLSLEDSQSADRMISFCVLPGEFENKLPVETWDGIPPVSENYQKARDSILERIRLLLDHLNPSR
jgi:protein-tyrosine-phosphatase